MEYTHYRQVDAAVDKLYAQGKHEEAIALLQAAVAPFPEYLFDTLWYQAFLYCEIGQYEKAYAIMEALIQKGYFCPLDWRGLDPLRGAEGFALLQKENERLKALAQSQAKMEHAVYLPEGYDADQSYPLFIVLHGDGGGGNLEQFPWYWPPEAVTRLGFVLVYVQSSQVLYSRNFGWLPNPAIARRDVKDCYDVVESQYAIDPGRIIIGGFSGGAITALDVTLAAVLPVKGFICQSAELKPESFTDEAIHWAAQRGVKGVLMEGEKVLPVQNEQEMMQVFQDAGLPYQFYINPGVGHVVPEDIAEKLQQGVDFILQ